MQILTKVSGENAFRFYVDVGVPTQTCADSLEDFLGAVRKVEVRSVEFHIGRGDFGRWMSLLGDELLAKQMVNLKGRDLRGEALRKRLVQILQLRIGRLRRASVQRKV